MSGRFYLFSSAEESWGHEPISTVGGWVGGGGGGGGGGGAPLVAGCEELS